MLQSMYNYRQKALSEEKSVGTHQHHFNSSPDKPPTSIFFRFLASRMTTVSLPAVGTYRREKQISPSFSCCWRGRHITKVRRVLTATKSKCTALHAQSRCSVRLQRNCSHSQRSRLSSQHGRLI